MTRGSSPVVLMSDFEPSVRRRLEAGFQKHHFGFCSSGEWPQVRDFIRDHWSASHPYVTCPELGDWMFRDSATGNYAFYLARDRESGAIRACVAYLLTSQFDRSIAVRDIWPGLWCASPGSAPGLGTECLRRLFESIRPRSIGGLGMSRDTVRILPKLGWTLGVMDHHYLLNPDLRDFLLVDHAPAGAAAPRNARSEARWLRSLDAREVETLTLVDFDPLARVPIKTGVYLANRYLRHPIYRYRVMAVETARGPVGVLVSRTCAYQNARAVRLVDFVGRDDAWPGMGSALIDLVREEKAEYADLYSAGLDPELLQAAGLTPHPPGDVVVIPNYFEPFERKNKVLDYGWIVPPGTRYTMFKGDSDQDRPNVFTPPAGTPCAED